MALNIYNSFSRKKELFVPIDKKQVKLYVCGPTVYGPPHVGHARSYTNFDVVRRYLDYLGYNVKYVQNITDVGHLVGDSDDGQDKILAQATKENIDPYALAYKYENIYFEYMDKLGIKRPTISARATGFIPEMIELVQSIIDKGFAYVTSEGNVYFSVHKLDSYGKLSGRKLENNLSGERITVADDKENPEDFALWKSAVGGHIMKWNSPWGVGYPGWHIECSALSKRFFGDTFDIHGGGLDNIFPHHESEIAQSEVANGKPFVNYFMHNNLVTVNGTKMGKSLGNFITLEQLFETFNPMLVRYFILQFHYRKPVDFSYDAIEMVKIQYNKMNEIFGKIKKLSDGEYNEVESAELVDIKESFISAMDDDFNTPVATAEMLRFSKIAAKILSNNNLYYIKEANTIVKMFEDILGFDFTFDDTNENSSQSNEDNEKLLDLISDIRTKLRAEKNYALSDYIRDELNKLDINIRDKKI
ncbi:MAG: cysteine--tRNA ligase [Clostridia bacterium]|nr:cysteine--tRNA ligase [Clostridia bacterium]